MIGHEAKHTDIYDRVYCRFELMLAVQYPALVKVLDYLPRLNSKQQHKDVKNAT